MKTTTSGADARLARETFPILTLAPYPPPRLFPQVYEGLTYKLSLAFPNDYPFKAPTVKFETPCFHPNVDQFGNICLDILKEKWSSVYDVRAVLLSIQSLLGEPNNASPLNAQAAQMWDNQEEYKKTLHKKYKDDVK